MSKMEELTPKKVSNKPTDAHTHETAGSYRPHIGLHWGYSLLL